MTKILAAYLWHGSGVTMTSWDKSQLTFATAWDWDKYSGLYLWLVVTWADLFLVISLDLIQWRIQGRASPLPYFPTKMTSEGPKFFFLKTAPHPHLSQGLDDRRPPPPPPLPLIWWSGSATVIKNREELEHSATQHQEDNRTDSLALLWLVHINSEDKWGTTGTSQSDPFNNDLWSIT